MDIKEYRLIHKLIEMHIKTTNRDEIENRSEDDLFIALGSDGKNHCFSLKELDELYNAICKYIDSQDINDEFVDNILTSLEQAEMAGKIPERIIRTVSDYLLRQLLKTKSQVA